MLRDRLRFATCLLPAVLSLFAISLVLVSSYSHAAVRFNSDIAYNSTDNQYLTVYVRYADPTSSFGTYYGQLVDENGADVGNEFAISGTDNAVISILSVAYSSGSNRYLVVWGQYPGGVGVPQIFGRYVE